MMVSPLAPTRPALRYHGGKWRLAPWIIRQFPAGHDVYVEPFAGSASVLFRKERSPIEVLNDLDGDVVNFFRVLREQKNALINAISLTPFAVEEWKLSMEPSHDPIEKARRFYVRCYMNRAGGTAQWLSGWRRQKVFTRELNGAANMGSAAVSFAKTEHLYDVADRLRGVFIESIEAIEVIQRYDTPRTLFYLDPPYVHETRSKWAGKSYRHEMTDDQHRELLVLLNGINGMAIISGYDCELYNDLLGATGWIRKENEVRVNATGPDGTGRNVEVLWISPNAQSNAEGYGHLPLFREENQ